jgi:aminoglycoside 2''-phosphotransferase
MNGAAVEIPLAYLERIREILPDIIITSALFNSDGMMNDVVIINDQAREVLAGEARILELVRETVEMLVPHFEYRAEDVVIYRLIVGEPLAREVVLRQDEVVQDRLAEQLATFLSQLYAIPGEVVEQRGGGASVAERSLEDWVRMFQDVERELFPFLWAYQKTWVRQLFLPVLDGQINLRYEPVLVHGDLGVYHILYDRTLQQINGIIDFGVAGLGDPAIDYACIISALGESFLRCMAHFYPTIMDVLDRARFRAGALELEWALHGIRSNDAAWWLAHIGGARDVMAFGT